jgi:hypothetical protein
LRERMAWVLIFILTFLPSTIRVLDCKLGFHTFLVWRCEKLTLFPYCFPFPVISHFCIIKIQVVSTDNSTSINR